MKITSALIHTCSRCDSEGWVCVLHRDRPWDGPRACGCGLAGSPCPTCNIVTGDELPRMPGGFMAREVFDEPLVSQR